jgi:hypothetical protein
MIDWLREALHDLRVWIIEWWNRQDDYWGNPR